MEYLFASCVTSDMINRLQQDGRAGIVDGVFIPNVLCGMSRTE